MHISCYIAWGQSNVSTQWILAWFSVLTKTLFESSTILIIGKIFLNIKRHTYFYFMSLVKFHATNSSVVQTLLSRFWTSLLRTLMTFLFLRDWTHQRGVKAKTYGWSFVLKGWFICSLARLCGFAPRPQVLTAPLYAPHAAIYMAWEMGEKP